MFRTSLRDATLHDVPVPAHSKVLHNIAAVNRDASRWDHADEFRLDHLRDVA